VIPKAIRSDHGTEHVEIHAVHCTYHDYSRDGLPHDKAYHFGKSTRNQKIEAFWSQLRRQWSGRWREIFISIEADGFWEKGDPIDYNALIYIYMPLIRSELATYRRIHNTFPIRRNNLSRLPYGPPEDIFLLRDDSQSVRIEPRWVELMRVSRLAAFDVDEYLPLDVIERLDNMMRESPYGEMVDISIAKEQYLFLREQMRQDQDLEYPLEDLEEDLDGELEALVEL
jgi:hypothetical protein